MNFIFNFFIQDEYGNIINEKQAKIEELKQKIEKVR